MNMLEKIQSQLEHLSKSERKVAEVILASPDNPSPPAGEETLFPGTSADADLYLLF